MTKILDYLQVKWIAFRQQLCHPQNRCQKMFRVLLGVFLFVIFIVAIFYLFLGSLFFVNRSPSATPGIYMTYFESKPQLAKGDFVIVKDPYDIPEIHIHKGALFLKQVRGLCGDTYRVTENELVVDNHSFFINNSLPYLPHVKPGLYSLHENEVLLLNDFTYSLDSRYFGPVSSDSIVRRVFLLVSFESIDRMIYYMIPDIVLHWMGMDYLYQFPD